MLRDGVLDWDPSVTVWLGVCWAGGPISEFHEQVVEPIEPNKTHYGDAMQLADLNDDGHADLLVSAVDLGWSGVYAYLGTPDGLDLSTEQLLLGPDGSPSLFGHSFAVGAALDDDGYAELVVGGADSTPGSLRSVLYLYETGPLGPVQGTRVQFQPTDQQDYSHFGESSAVVGDADGDGLDDLLVGDRNWLSPEGIRPGAAYLYPGTEGGLAGSADILLTVDGLEAWDSFAETVGAVGDINGDGFQDLGVYCSGCEAIYLWPGGSGDIAGTEPYLLRRSDYDPDDWVSFGVTFSGGDFDGDGSGDLAVRSGDGAYVFQGAADWELEATEAKLFDWSDGDWRGLEVAAAGDLDLDGFADLLVGEAGDGGYETYPTTARIYYGSKDGIDASSPYAELTNADGKIGTRFGRLVGSTAADVDGDGRPEFAVGALYAKNSSGEYGRVHVFSAACDWYRDADGDGYGDPAMHQASCEPVSGYTSNDDDCDDGDASVFGHHWYLDGDGDGWGTLEGRVLACEQPEGSSETWLDCDDTDASIHPGAEDIGLDGIDQDCDGYDSQVVDTSPPDSPVDTGSPDSPVDTSPPDSEPATTDSPTGDSGTDPQRPLGRLARDRCGGCSTGSGALLVLFGALLLARRRRP
jgi:hypothetical protein